MKKFLTIVTGVVVLGAGVYVDPANAAGRYEAGRKYTREESSSELNALIDRGNEIIRLTTDKGASASVCALWAERPTNLARIRSHGVWLGDKEFHQNEEQIARHNISACKDHGYVGGHPAPVAQRQPSYSDPSMALFEEAARQTGIPLSVLMGPGAAVPGQSNEQRERSCENASGRWIKRGPNGWPFCDRSTGASHGVEMPGPPTSY